MPLPSSRARRAMICFMSPTSGGLSCSLPYTLARPCPLTVAVDLAYRSNTELHVNKIFFQNENNLTLLWIIIYSFYFNLLHVYNYYVLSFSFTMKKTQLDDGHALNEIWSNSIRRFSRY
jgi:hypothetical protein